MQVVRCALWGLVLALIWGWSAPAEAIEAFDGRLQVHGAASQQFRVVADGYRLRNHNWFLSKMATRLSVEIEAEIFPNGIGPFDIVEGFARVDVSYDCIWEHACHMAPQWNYFGDDARRWPANLANGKTRGVTGVLPNPLEPVEDEQPDRELIGLAEVDPFSTLFTLGNETDIDYVFGAIFPAKVSTKYIQGSLSPLNLTLGPINPEFEIDSTGILEHIEPGVQPPRPLRPDNTLGSIYVPSPALRNRIKNYDNGDLNFTENELAWDLGASQQQTKQLKEAYLDITMLDGRFVMRLGKQITRWGKTELFRSGTPDQLNPQDLAISNLPSFEESLIALWQARMIYSFYDVGPFEDVRLEAVVNLDHFEPSDLGDCGEPYTVFLVCLKQVGFLAHGITGLGVAGERRPPKFWEDAKGLEFGLRLEFRIGRFGVSLTDFYGYDDFPTGEWFNTFDRNVDPFTGRPRRWRGEGPCNTALDDPDPDPSCLLEAEAFDFHPGNRQLYDTTCRATQTFEIEGPLGDAIDMAGGLGACVISIFNSDVELAPGLTIVRLVSEGLGGGDFFNNANNQGCLAFCGAIGRNPLTADNMTVPLHPGLLDGARSGNNAQFGLQGFLSPQQEALLGCGPFYGARCNQFGIDLFNMEASVVFQAFPQAEHANRLLDGAIGTRFVPGVGVVQLPGTRSVFNYFDDPVGYRWNPTVDGCVVGFRELDEWDPAGTYGSRVYDDLIRRGVPVAEAQQCDVDPGAWRSVVGDVTAAVGGVDPMVASFQSDGYAVPIPDRRVPGGTIFASTWRNFDQTDDSGPWDGFAINNSPDETAGGRLSVAEIRARFPNEMAVVSENLARLLVGFSLTQADVDPRCDVALDVRVYCEFLNAFFEVTAVQRPEKRAGGTGVYGRRDMSWLSGSEIDLFYERRNVLGLSLDFAEDWSQTTWGIDLTWLEDQPYTNNRAEKGYSKEDTINLTMSIDRPTFINFLNANRTVFFNSQLFLRYIPRYQRRDTFDVDGPFALLATLTAFTGFWQDRLMTFVTLVHEVESNSGGQIVTMTYRYSESFSATVGISSFYGEPSRQRVHYRSPATRFHCCDYTQRSNFRGVSAIAERDEIFFEIRKTF